MGWISSFAASRLLRMSLRRHRHGLFPHTVKGSTETSVDSEPAPTDVPRDNRTRQQIAWDDGHRARLAGQSEDSCPFTYLSDEYHAWVDAWEKAHNDLALKKIKESTNGQT